MTTYRPNPLLDAGTVLVGLTHHGASRPEDQVLTSGTVVQLNTKLDATSRFTFLVMHPGHHVAVEVLLELAPQLRDGTMGTFVPVATVAIPAEGGRVEAYISGHDIQLDPADRDDVDGPSLCFARAIVTSADADPTATPPVPSTTPEGMVVALSATLPA